MQSILYFWLSFLVLLILIIFMDRKFQMLRDNSSASPKPYSYARVQLAWWTLVVMSSMIGILLGITAGIITQVLRHLSGVNPCIPGDTDCANHPLNYFMPVISNNNLILMGLSSGTYAALKTTENKA